ncbi:uncharacterized protein LOC104584844 isoform X3 [Brachypodium distachyon]|uniref:uncharacterized protein LOC104584844 isoform X3 n=1 Tax=Brachypodium distachyon TaxID=15368 RepID=UPI000D0DF51B|nr:uncharacterized protein LOC104584844 isoform X3 [Brachypodium distachyon]|eukprot:XP_024310722.1 uncharacterized protein LOC104584844 isoform X3 [Brachypodium distachyon]
MRVQLVQMIQNLNVSNCQIAELGLGGPLVHSDKYFVGINIRYAKGRTWCLPFMSIRERLEQFRILTPRNLEGSDDSGNLEGSDDSGQEERDETNLYGAGSSSGTTETSSQGYSPPPGFMRRQKWLDSMGYPRPPPLMLEQDILLVDTPDQIRDRQFRRMSREELELKKKVVAVGREPEEGLLCASFGVVTKELITSGCKELRMSTCKIKKKSRYSFPAKEVYYKSSTQVGAPPITKR